MKSFSTGRINILMSRRAISQEKSQYHMTKAIRVVLAEDQVMVLEAIASLLQSQGDIEVVGRAETGDEALRLIATQQPDVLICDIGMPDMNGVKLARDVRDRFPGVRTVVLTTFAKRSYFQQAMSAGVFGFMFRDRPSAELAECVRRVHRGQRVIDPEAAALADAANFDL
jgi:two-component system response regulator DesR